LLRLPPRPQECKRSGIAYISPEHIMLAMLGQGDCMARRVLVRWGARAPRPSHD
jgi:hypothetical protein